MSDIVTSSWFGLPPIFAIATTSSHATVVVVASEDNESSRTARVDQVTS